MYCKNCGQTLNEGATFCPSCGAAAEQSASSQTRIVNNYYPQARQPISVLGWIGRCLIPAIPIVGSLIYLIMLFVWAGDKNKEESFNNWAKAQLWVMLIAVILAIVIFVFAFLLGMFASMSY